MFFEKIPIPKVVASHPGNLFIDSYWHTMDIWILKVTTTYKWKEIKIHAIPLTSSSQSDSTCPFDHNVSFDYGGHYCHSTNIGIPPNWSDSHKHLLLQTSKPHTTAFKFHSRRQKLLNLSIYLNKSPK